MPVEDDSAYPAFEDIQLSFERSLDEVMAVAKSMNDEGLARETDQDAHGFVKDKLDTLAKLAWHESWHEGQLA